MKVLMISEDDLRQVLSDQREFIVKDLMEALDLNKQPKKLSAKGAAEYLGISLSTLYKRVNEIPHTKFGKKLIFTTDELDRIIIGPRLDSGSSGNLI